MGMESSPRRYLAVSEVRMGEHFRQRARGDEFAAAHAGAGAEVENVIGVPDGVGIVLDDEHGVAEVAQAGQRAQQAVVVALVQADAGLVQDVEHAHQAGADLGRQADALGLAAAQGAAFAVEREVAQADVLEEAEPGADFLDELMGDLLLELRQLQSREELVGPLDREGADVHDGEAGEGEA